MQPRSEAYPETHNSAGVAASIPARLRDRRQIGARDAGVDGMKLTGCTYQCERCGHREDLDSRHWRCPACGGAFGLDGPNQLVAADIDNADSSLWRYAGVLPVQRSDARSLGEGMTPLVAGSLAGRPVW